MDSLHGVEDIVALRARIAACRACQDAGLLAEAAPIAHGPTHARVLVVGQAPGVRSHVRRRHFAGPAGRVLEQWFDRAGFPPGYFREQAYLSSLTRCFPGPAPRGQGDRRPTPTELRLCRPFLEAELRLLDPAVVLLVGKMAIEYFLGPCRLEEVVGTLVERDGRRYLPLPHSSGVSRWLNDPGHRTLVDCALARLAACRKELGL
ncbi:MAG TPA: uracil-DNA glycosylase family protein [Chloroflexota bacterium]|nr:uracil-DNA glycosylase family protein [Chloroflexota bacterium]